MIGYNDLEFTITKICQRRGKVLQKIESEALTIRCTFGLADNTQLLALTANTFYVIDGLTICVVFAQTVAGIALSAPKLGGGSAGTWFIGTPLTAGSFIGPFTLEADDLRYFINGNTGGTISLSAMVYKVTMTA